MRVAPSMNAQAVANTIWGLATLGWQVGDGPMRDALEAAAVRVAPSMNAQEVANTICGLATLGWQANSDLSAVLQQHVEAFAHERGPVQLSTAHLSQLLQLLARNRDLEIQLKAYKMAQPSIIVGESEGRRWCGAAGRCWHPAMRPLYLGLYCLMIAS